MVDGPTGPRDGGDEEGEEREEPSPLGAAPTLAVTRPTRKERRTRRNEGDGPRRRLPRFGVGPRALAVVVGIVVLAFGPALASGLKKTPRNMIGISYGGGPIESAHFQRIVKPGSSLFFNGWFDPFYLYPSDQQNYIISKSPRVGAVTGKDSVIAPTADRVQLTYQVAVYFKLNTDLLRQFHEQLGLRYKAYTARGWNNLLQDTFRQQIENALQQQTRRYDVAELYGNANLLIQLQDTVQTTVGQRLIGAMGEPYFCAPTFKPGGKCDPPRFIVKQIDLPSSVVNAFLAVRTSDIQIQVERNKVAQRRAEAAAITALNAALKEAGINYVILRGIESGKINFWVIPTGSGLTLNPSGNGTSGATPSTPSAPTTTSPGG